MTLEAELAAIERTRKDRGWMTFAEATERMRLQRAMQVAADEAAEAKAEGRLLPQQRTNPHAP